MNNLTEEEKRYILKAMLFHLSLNVNSGDIETLKALQISICEKLFADGKFFEALKFLRS